MSSDCQGSYFLHLNSTIQPELTLPSPYPTLQGGYTVDIWFKPDNYLSSQMEVVFSTGIWKLRKLGSTA